MIALGDFPLLIFLPHCDPQIRLVYAEREIPKGQEFIVLKTDAMWQYRDEDVK